MAVSRPPLPCPLCAQPAFAGVDALRCALVRVAACPLSCPVCSDVLQGLDKLTIHLFGHTLLQQGATSTSAQGDATTQAPDVSASVSVSGPCKTQPPAAIAPQRTGCATQCQPRAPTQLAPYQVGSRTSAENQTRQTQTQVLLEEKQPIPHIRQKLHDHHQFLQQQQQQQQQERQVTPSQQRDLSPTTKTLPSPTHAKADDTSRTPASTPGFVCHLCPKAFKMRGSLMVHLRVAHSGLDAGRILRTWMESAQQLQQDSEPKTFSCTTCCKSFKKEHQLTQHLKTHDGKQWECDVCSKLFTTKYFLKKHKRLHTGEMPYKCPTCDKTFTFQQSYHKHLLYHSDEKPHVCTECERAFKELSTLHNHQRIHTGEKPFACETCGKCFRQRVSYLVHRRIHTGAMPYRCTACGKSFRYKVSQRTHKCPAQPPGTVVRQSGDLVQRLINGAQRNGLQMAESQKMAGTLCNEAKPTNQDSAQTSKNSHSQPLLNKRTEDINNISLQSVMPDNKQLLSQPSNQFIILFDGNLQHNLPSGILVTAPPLMVLPPETNTKNIVSQWPVGALNGSQEGNLQITKLTNINDSCSKNTETTFQNNQDSLHKTGDSEKSTRKESEQRDSKERESTQVNLSNDMWYNSPPETTLAQLDSNKISTLSNIPDTPVPNTDFFTLVMSPQLMNSLPSPSESLKQLTLSPQGNTENEDQSAALLQLYMPSITSQASHSTTTKFNQGIESPKEMSESTCTASCSGSDECKFDSSKDDSASFHMHNELVTINEESLKQLLYGHSS